MADSSFSLWTINDKLCTICDYPFEDHTNDEYYWDYDELFNELSNMAADLLEEARGFSGFMINMPNVHDDYAGCWFNVLAAVMSDATFKEIYADDEYVCDFYEMEYKRKQLLTKLERLKKAEYIKFSVDALNFILRYIEIKNAFDTLLGVCSELESNQAFHKAKAGRQQEPKAAWL